MEEVESGAVKKAYERIKASQLPEEVQKEYAKQEEQIFKKIF